MFSSHRNTQGEVISIKRVTAGEFLDQHVLIIKDDPKPRGSGIEAPMLLDQGTQAWLLRSIEALQNELDLAIADEQNGADK